MNTSDIKEGQTIFAQNQVKNTGLKAKSTKLL